MGFVYSKNDKSMSKVDELFAWRFSVFPLVGAVEGVGAVEAATRCKL